MLKFLQDDLQTFFLFFHFSSTKSELLLAQSIRENAPQVEIVCLH